MTHKEILVVIVRLLTLALLVSATAKAELPPCPTVKELHAHAKGRYSEIVIWGLKWDSWRLIQIVDGWAVFQDTYDDSFPWRHERMPDHSFLVAIRESSIRLKKFGTIDDPRVVVEPLQKGQRLFSTVWAFGVISEVKGKDRDGFPVRIKRAEAIYPAYSGSRVQ